MILYHGTNTDFQQIDLSLCLPYKDFGQGFYLTSLRDQALRMAERKSHRFGTPIVQVYEVDDEVLQGHGDCRVKVFEQPDKEWAQFILSNRDRTLVTTKHEFDIVIGPVADDGVAYILNRFSEGSYTLDDVVRELRYARLSNQFFFGTERAIRHLKRITTDE